MTKRTFRGRLNACSSIIAIYASAAASVALAAEPLSPNDLNTVTPIKHVIVIYEVPSRIVWRFGLAASPIG